MALHQQVIEQHSTAIDAFDLMHESAMVELYLFPSQSGYLPEIEYQKMLIMFRQGIQSYPIEFKKQLQNISADHNLMWLDDKSFQVSSQLSDGSEINIWTLSIKS